MTNAGDESNTDRTQISPPWTSADNAAMQHAWDWFSLHAAQRMQVLSFFFVGLALVVAGYGAAFQADSFSIAGALAVAGLVICGGFVYLEERTRQLGRACEPALAAFEAALSSRNSAGATVNFVAAVETPSTLLKASYSTVIRFLIVVASVLMVVGAVYAFTADEPKPITSLCSGSFDSKDNKISRDKKSKPLSRSDKTGFVVKCAAD